MCWLHRSRNVNCHFLLMPAIFFLHFFFDVHRRRRCCHFLLISINHIFPMLLLCCAFMFWRDDRSIGMGSLLQFKQFMCTNILTVRAWLLMSSLTHSTQHDDCSVLFNGWEMMRKNLTIFFFFLFRILFFFIIANQIKRLQFFLLSTAQQHSEKNFFESRLQVFCDTSQFLHFSL